MSTAGWWGRDQLYALLYCLTDCYDNNKELALQLLCAHDLTVLDLQVSSASRPACQSLALNLKVRRLPSPLTSKSSVAA